MNDIILQFLQNGLYVAIVTAGESNETVISLIENKLILILL